MAWSPSNRQLTLIKSAIFLVSLLPAAQLLYATLYDQLGANPVETLTHGTGTWTFHFLLITLAISPLRHWTRMHWLLRLRRMLGLYCFFYAFLHFLCFAFFDHGFALANMWEDVIKRPFISVGFCAFVLLVPLAATSFNRAIRALGGKRWQTLHRTVYLIGVLSALHFIWLVKMIALIEPLIYSLILALLLGWRVLHWRNKISQIA